MAELSTIARPYAEAAFAAAGDDAAGLTAWSGQLAELAALADLDDVRAAMSDPRLNASQRVELLTGLVRAPLAPAVKNLVVLLVDNGRVLLLPEIASQFEVLKRRREGVALAEITSAFPLSDAQRDELVSGLEKKFGLTLTPVVTVDASLIGGVRVVVGDQVLDTSVQAQLARMRDKLAA